MVRVSMVIGLCCAVCGGCAGWARRAATPPPAAAAVMDERVTEVMAAMGRALAAAPALSLRAEGMMDEPLADGTTVRLHRRSDVYLRRPDRLYVRTEGDDVDRAVWYNGRTVTLLDKRAGRFASFGAPDSVEAMLDFVVERYGLTVPVADLLFPDPHETLTADVWTGEHLGVRTVNGHRRHHLAFSQERIDWQIWIDAGDTPLPRKLLIVHKTEPTFGQYTVDLDSWDLSADLGDGVFEFHHPGGASAVTVEQLFGIAKGE